MTPTLVDLWNAAHVCDPCGCEWGRPRSGDWSHWEAACDLCRRVGSVSHVRNYGWLQRGVARLERGHG